MDKFKTRKVILDVDTGSDDAIAIMCAIKSKNIQLEAICTVWGNLTVDKTTLNTLGVCEALNADIPVYSGCNRPMVKDRSKYRDLEDAYEPLIVDGKELKIHYDRLEGIPESKRKAESRHAVRFYYDYLTAATEPVTLIAVGPLTNLGFLFRLAPHLASKVEQLIIMGGGVDITNCSRAGEANIWHDPEAFQIILDTGIHPLLVPLDATHAAGLNLDDCEKLEGLNTFAARFTARLARQRIEYESARFGEDHNWSAIHDALAVCASIDETVLENVEEVACRAGLSGSADGEVLIDRREVPEKANASIALSANKEKFLAMLCQLFAD